MAIGIGALGGQVEDNCHGCSACARPARASAGVWTSVVAGRSSRRTSRGSLSSRRRTKTGARRLFSEVTWLYSTSATSSGRTQVVASARSEMKDSLGVDPRYLDDPKGALSRDLLGDDVPTLPTNRRGVAQGVGRALGLDDEPTRSDAGGSTASDDRPAAPGPDGVDPDQGNDQRRARRDDRLVLGGRFEG